VVENQLPFERVLVAGAGGWLGRRLVDVLANGLADDERFRSPRPGLAIRALVLPGDDASALHQAGGGIEVVTGDLRNPADCQRFCAGAVGGLLIQAAGVIHPKKVSEFYAVNLQGTKNLLEAAVAAGIRRAVVVSSNSPIGCNPTRGHLFDENSPYHPYMGYGRSKMLMEVAVKELQQAGKIETVIVRPPWFYGPFQPPRQGLFFKMIRDGKAPIVGDGGNLRSMAYIDNLCQGLLLAGSVQRANGAIYWIADRRPYTMNEIIDTIENLLENEFQTPCAHKRMRLPSVASTVARVIDKNLQMLGLYHQKIHVLSEMNQTIACSVQKAETELGYRPTVELKEGMRRSLQWMKDAGQDELFRK
jgi:nucleoside-diphosphate-sugar epimerase